MTEAHKPVTPDRPFGRYAPVILNIQTLRVFFAFLVVTAHLEAVYVALGIVDPTRTISVGANDGFFIVSAFAIVYASLRKPTSALEFLGRRFARLVPFYWGITLFTALLVLIAPSLFQSTRVTPETLAKSLLFIPYLKHAGMVQPIVFVGWAMNYIMFVILVHGLAKYFAEQRAWMWTAGVLLSLALIGAVVQPANVVAAFYTGPKLVSYAFGVLLAGLWFNRPVTPKRQHDPAWRALAIALIVGGFAVRLVQQNFFRDIDMRLIAPLATAGIVTGTLLLEANGDRHKGVIRDRIAEATFSIYLTHYFVTQAVVKTLSHLAHPSPFVLIAGLVVAYVGAIVLGLLVCQYVEKPLDLWVRSAWRRLTPARQPLEA